MDALWSVSLHVNTYRSTNLVDRVRRDNIACFSDEMFVLTCGVGGLGVLGGKGEGSSLGAGHGPGLGPEPGP
jgi:hypothetical protein